MNVWTLDFSQNFSQIQYPQKEAAVLYALILAGLVVMNLVLRLFRRDKISQRYSGHLISGHYGRSFLRLTLDLAFRTLFAVGSALFILALTEPFVPSIKTMTVIKESRERVDLIDVSTSKGWLFEETGKSAGQLGREAHLRFLKMRQGKNDRVSFWVFSGKAVKGESFIIDDGLYYQQVEDAPYVITSPGNPWLPQFNRPESCHVNIPESRLELVPFEGGTRLDAGLGAVIKYFDQEGRKDIKRKAVIIETDAVVDIFPETELRELRKRRISPYFLHIKPNEECEKLAGNEYRGLVNAQKLKTEIKKYGGKFYDIQDVNSLRNAYQDIDRLEAVKFKDTYATDKIFLFQTFIFFGILVLVAAVALTLISDISDVYP